MTDMAEHFPDFSPSDSAITSTRIRRLVAYWESRRNGRPVPLRDDIDPAAIRDLLPLLLIAEIEEPFRVRYRLVGTRVVEFNRLDFTGTYLDEMRWDSSERYTRAYHAVVASGLPHYGLDSWPLSNDTDGRSEIVMLPLSSSGARIDRCLGLEDFFFSPLDLRRQASS
ncbi:PAS domain-containing protein [Dongia sp.]|uniref:PAS domain-containing protein n=1 Tax=Dongia sp. TaxID=1977262 RepID=UPI0035B01052